MTTCRHIVLFLVFVAFSCSAKIVAAAETQIIVSKAASPLETLAAREVMRYVYLRTGRLLKIAQQAKPVGSDAIIIARKDSPFLQSMVGPILRRSFDALQPQQFILKSLRHARAQKRVLIIGGDDAGTLYGTYRFIQKLGVRFYLHGDVIPDKRIAFALPTLNETGKPLFELRGIQPFHDFPEGPDWWNKDDYLAHISQLPKLGMNFIGLHCYPEGTAGPEPAVWIGQPADVDAKGRVTFSYPSRWANTAIRVRWGYEGLQTTEFSGGASLLFDKPDYGPDVMQGMLPHPKTLDEQNTLFNNVGDLLHTAFSHARSLGVKTAIGTETPLTVPGPVRERLQQQGKDPQDPAVVREIYRGIFQRITRTHPLDYYWLWTPENWIWGGNKPGQFEATVADIEAAQDALRQSGNPFTLATSGWVLGPQNDRAALDNVLPKSSPISSINQFHSHGAIDPAFANVLGRPKWAIPWLENDRSMTSPQLWVGRLRYDAADALRLGATGLMGIHWRTKVIAPTIAALAAASWNQDFVPPTFDRSPVMPHPIPVLGAVGGENVLGTEPVAGTPLSIIYQSVRLNMDGYNLKVPNGLYKVTLQFSEPTFDQPGRRVFGIKLQGRPVLDELDIFARVGKLRALDIDFPGVRVDDGYLRIEFSRRVDLPLVGGIVIEGTQDVTSSGPAALYVRKINAAGGAYAGYEAERPKEALAEERNRTMPIHDFYLDYARANFGDEVAIEAGRILTAVDGVNLPSPSEWIQGPGGVQIETAPWAQVKTRYRFVDELAALRPQVKGAGNRERFEYWLRTFRCAEAMAKLGTLRGQLDAVMKTLHSEADAARQKELAARALSLRIDMARGWARMMSLQVTATDTSGEMGTLANLEQHSRKWIKFLSFHDAALATALGTPLPASVEPTKEYQGPARILVPTVRSQATPGERLTLKVILLSSPQKELPHGTLYWRRLGKGKFSALPLRHVAQRVYRVAFPPLPQDTTAIEYYIRATCGSARLLYPPTAPALNQTVVVHRMQ